MICPKDGRFCTTHGKCLYPCLTRKDLDRLGVPSDLTAADVLAFFSLPDDDDEMHKGRSR